MNFKLIVFLFLSICTINILSSQINLDYQWYVKNSKLKNAYSYSTQTNLNSINASGVYPNCNYCSPNKGRKDFFIIFENGECINTRPPANIDNYPITENNFKIISNSGLIKYFYATNIYQGDDPPGLVTISDGAGYSCTNEYTLSATTESFSVTHDFVPGKDVTVILPMERITTCTTSTISLEYDKSLFPFSDVFIKDDNINYSWSYLNNSSIVETPLGITGIPIDNSKPYHYFNLRVQSPLPAGIIIGEQKAITLKCGTQEIGKIVETVRDKHDPNFIEVKCIYKQVRSWYNPWSKDRYFVKYKIQFMNDGTLPVEDVKVNFTLPSVVKANTLKVGNWSFGDKTGCGRGPCLVYTPSFPNIEFNFNKFCPHYLTADDSDPATVPDIKQYGLIEFCVEINTDPSHFNSVSLQPTNPTTNFGMNHIYSIEHYIDNCTPNPNNKADCIRPIYSSIINATCSCDCPSDFDFKKPKKGL